MALKRESILKKRSLPTEKVPCPEWADEGTPADDAYVIVRTLTGTERDKWEATLTTGKGSKAKVTLEKIRAKLAVAVCVDDDGHPIFSEADVTELSERSCLPLGRVFDAASKLNGLSKEDVDELVGESKSDQS